MIGLCVKIMIQCVLSFKMDLTLVINLFDFLDSVQLYYHQISIIHSIVLRHLFKLLEINLFRLKQSFCHLTQKPMHFCHCKLFVIYQIEYHSYELYFQYFFLRRHLANDFTFPYFNFHLIVFCMCYFQFIYYPIQHLKLYLIQVYDLIVKHFLIFLLNLIHYEVDYLLDILLLLHLFYFL